MKATEIKHISIEAKRSKILKSIEIMARLGLRSTSCFVDRDDVEWLKGLGYKVSVGGSSYKNIWW